jgi:hypothetical protein
VATFHVSEIGEGELAGCLRAAGHRDPSRRTLSMRRVLPA